LEKPKITPYFYKNYKFRFLPYFIKQKLRWKDKWSTPRCESEPFFKFEWLWFGIEVVWGSDNYWEEWLWIYKYNDGNYEKAKQDWGWTRDGKSTWIDY